MYRAFGASLVVAFMVLPVAADENLRAYKAWIAQVKTEARAAGVKRRYVALLDAVKPDTEVLRLSVRQPEYIKPIWDYLEKMVSPERLRIGLDNMAAQDKLLARLEKKYGVPREIVTAIWGMESNYGKNLGSFPVLQALASLGYGGEREEFARTQLIAALGILQNGDIAQRDFLGSWAGAMGHTQFIPTTYRDYAVDANGDGKRDIWNDPKDALASTANYLARSGWQAGLVWGLEVRLPSGFDYRVSDYQARRTASQWHAMGLRAVRGRIDATLGECWLYLPSGHRGPAFLVTRNFDALLRYNAAPAYALAVSLLADSYDGVPRFSRGWPITDRPVSIAEIKEIQTLLQQTGHDVGGVDGVVGRQTRAAIREAQTQFGMIPDGYVSTGLLRQLRRFLQ